MRIYNPSLGKFLSVDPLAAKYPFQTPYAFAENTPIWATDLDGGEANLGNKLVNQAATALYTNAEALNQIAKSKKVDSYSLQIAAGVQKWFANGLASMASMGGQNNPQTTSSTIPPCGGVAPYTKAQKAENAWMASYHDQEEVDAKRFKEGDVSTKTEVLVGMASRYAAVFFPAEETANIPTRPMNGQVQFEIPFKSSGVLFEGSSSTIFENTNFDGMISMDNGILKVEINEISKIDYNSTTNSYDAMIQKIESFAKSNGASSISVEGVVVNEEAATKASAAWKKSGYNVSTSTTKQGGTLLSRTKKIN
jgi:hypothetical protein